MALIIGLTLALAVGVIFNALRFDRDRAFYPTVMIVIAALYILFAAMGASTRTLGLESLAAVVFMVLAVYGFRSSLWLVAGALALHGVFDLVHGALIDNPGVPAWWPDFCLGYDVMAAVYLAWLLGSGKVRATA